MKDSQNQGGASDENRPIVDNFVDKSWLDDYTKKRDQEENRAGSSTSGGKGKNVVRSDGQSVSLAKRDGEIISQVKQDHSVSSMHSAAVMTGESDIAFFEFPNPLLHRSIGALNSSELVQFGADWRAGALTIRQLCDRWQLALTDVLKLGDRYGARAVREEYRLRLATGLLDPEAALGAAAGGEQSVLPRDRSAAVDRAVGRAVEVVGAHKVAISGARQLTEALVAELSVTTVGQAEMSEWCTIAAEVRAGLRDRVTGAEREAREGKAGDAQQATFARALAMFEQLISLPSRADSINKMAGALAKLVVLERQAYQIADDPGGNPAEHVPLEERLRRYAESGSIAGVIDVQAIAS